MQQLPKAYKLLLIFVRQQNLSCGFNLYSVIGSNVMAYTQRRAEALYIEGGGRFDHLTNCCY